MSASSRIRSRKSAISVSRAVLTRASSAMTNTSVKNRSTAGRRPAISVNACAIVGARRRRLDARPARVERGEQRQLGRLGQRARDRAAPCAFSSRAMFLTRLNSTASAWKSSDAAHAPAAPPRRAAPAAARRRRRPTRRRARPRPEAALLEREAHALVRERDDGVGVSASAASAAEAPVGAQPARPRRPSSRSIPASSGRSIRIRTMPCICRRSPNGSREPVDSLAGMRSARRRCPACRPATPPPTSPPPSPSCAARRRRVRLDADRQVVVVDRLPHLLRLPFLAGVDAAHRPLQLGELEHHVGREVGLGEPGRRSRRASAASGCPNTSVGDPARPAARSARPCRGSCPASCGRARCAAARAATRASILRSASQKNLRVAQPRRRPRARRSWRSRRSSAGCVLTTARNASFSSPRLGQHRKVVLVVHQRGRQHFLGSSRNAAVEEAGDDGRELDQIGDLVDQRRDAP